MTGSSRFDPLLAGKLDLGLRYDFWPSEELTSKKLLVVLHGRGDTMEGFHWLPEALNIESFNYLFLNAPDVFEMGYSWYGLPPNQGPGVIRSRGLLTNLVDRVCDGCGLKKSDVFLLGFSQGCLMSIDFGLRYGELLGGIVGISGYVFFLDEYPRAFSTYAPKQHFFVTHGRQDEVLPLEKTLPSVLRLRKLGVAIDWREYDKEHTVDPVEELPEIREFLLRLLEAS